MLRYLASLKAPWSTRTEHTPPIQTPVDSTPVDIDTGNDLHGVTFSANGEYLVASDLDGVQVWRVKDGKRTGKMEAASVRCLAVSSDGKWIAAGTIKCKTFLWNAATCERVLKHAEVGSVHALDFSPDSARLVSAGDSHFATIWDVVHCKQVQTLDQNFGGVSVAAKYSPDGHRIATASYSRVRVWDSTDGSPLMTIQVNIAPYYNRGLLWFYDHLLVISDNTIKQFEVSTGSTVSQWPVLDAGPYSCFALAKRAGPPFIAYATNGTVTFYDTSTNIQLGQIRHPHSIRAIAISPDDGFLAVGEERGKVTIQSLARITDDDATSNPTQHHSAPTTPTPRLRAWANATLANRSWKDVLVDAASFTLPRTTIYRVMCECLETMGYITDAVGCFHQMTSEFGGETNLHGEAFAWTRDFVLRSFKKLEHLGDLAANAQQHDKAVSHYTTAVSLNLSFPSDIFIKRNKALMTIGSWKEALDDANHVIKYDPTSPWGYEMKHAALHMTRDYDSAVEALETMLSNIAKSPDPDVQRQADQYINPSSTRATIRKIVQRAIRHLPRVLINITTGHLHHRAEQASAFESSPIFNELVSSMTRRIDYVRIKREVRQYFRYVMLSHKWEDNEPLFQQVLHITVYDLGESPTHNKLQMFCKIVRDAGFEWAWSDTCCINKSDHFVLQEALVAMFKWYQGSAMVIVFLRGVRSSSRSGALVESVWNTRAWTLQEYVAGKVVHFYTEDWTLYLDLKVPNHKESAEVILEMERATGVSAQQLMALRPGLSNIREKLRLASPRQTTLVEDAAYSLLGIFSVAGIPAIYGEGEGSLGRLLAHVLTGSGDASILAWTGESSSFNSCLPAHITVFKGPATSHIPPPVPDAEMESTTAALGSSLDVNMALGLYDRLNELSPPWFAASRMKLPFVAFEISYLSLSQRTRSGRVYRADTDVFGTVEIKTKHDLSRMGSLYLIHPWLDALLEREEIQGGISDVAPSLTLDMDNEENFDEDVDEDVGNVLSPVEPRMPFLPTRTVPMDRETRARRLVARLRQPFGALLVAPVESGRRAMDYRRVAADSLITVQIQGSVLLADILDNVRTFDVL